MKYPDLNCDDLALIGSTNITSYYRVVGTETHNVGERQPKIQLGTILYISDGERSAHSGELGVCYPHGDSSKKRVFFYCNTGSIYTYDAYILTELEKASLSIVDDFNYLLKSLQVIDNNVDTYLEDYIEGLV